MKKLQSHFLEETHLEQDTLTHNEKANNQERPNSLNILIETRTHDLVPNTGGNSQMIEKNDNHIIEVEKGEEINILEDEILQAHGEIPEEKVDNLVLLDNGEKNGGDIVGKVVISYENLKKQIKDNEETSASLNDFEDEDSKCD